MILLWLSKNSFAFVYFVIITCLSMYYNYEGKYFAFILAIYWLLTPYTNNEGKLIFKYNSIAFFHGFGQVLSIVGFVPKFICYEFGFSPNYLFLWLRRRYFISYLWLRRRYFHSEKPNFFWLRQTTIYSQSKKVKFLSCCCS